MNNPFFISELAIKDLEEIWVYTYNNWTLEQADRYYEAIINEINFISNHHKIGKSVDYIKKDYRVAEVKSHLIFYKINKQKILIVIRILHKNMDIENRLK